MLCPNCKETLIKKDNVYICKHNHSFDIAKEGYANLLLSNKKNSQFPGDNKEMVSARVQFLQKGYYEPLANRIKEVIKAINKTKVSLLDAGCGVGYYSIHMKEIMAPRIDLIGIDISKFAVRAAAKRDKESQYFVASIFDLPIEDKSQDVILNIFSPKANEEYKRILKDDGILIQVMPGKKHLYELKELLYKEKTYENEPQIEYEGFDIIETIPLTYEIVVNKDDLIHLFTMTPYLYKTKIEDIENLQSVNDLKITIDFIIAVWRKA